MKEIRYLDILLLGILKNQSGFKNYLVRKQKESEKKYFVSKVEFFENCNETLYLLENRIESQFLEKKYELYQTIELLK
jgi:protoheme ferro-lyase